MPAKKATAKAKAPARKVTKRAPAKKGAPAKKQQTTRTEKLRTAPPQKPKAPTPRDAKQPAPDECPKGGVHEWKEEDGERFCGKCFAPANAKAEKKNARKPKAKGPAKDKKLSAIDAAVKVLAESRQPMNAKEMIEAMAAKKLWTSPGGKTPHLTLYSAILREINNKGKDARFKKAERGKFAVSS